MASLSRSVGGPGWLSTTTGACQDMPSSCDVLTTMSRVTAPFKAGRLTSEDTYAT